MNIINIIYIPENNTLQSLVSFDYKGQQEYCIVYFDLSTSTIPTDFLAIAKNDVFITAFEESKNAKIVIIETPSPILQ